MPARIGIVVALPAEAKAIFGIRHWNPSGGWNVQQRILNSGTALLAVQSGVGFDNAYGAAMHTVRHGASALIAMGVSGGLDPGLGAGDLVVADTVIKPGNGVLRPDAEYGSLVCKTLRAGGVSVCRGAIVTVKRPVLCRRQKKSLFQKSRARAVDMESAAVARAAVASNLPFFVLRAVCDTAHRDVPAALVDPMDGRGAIRRSMLARALLNDPSLVATLLVLGKAFADALMALRRGWRLQVNRDLPDHLSGGSHDHVTSR